MRRRIIMIVALLIGIAVASTAQTFTAAVVAERQLTPFQLGLVFSAFGLTYAAGEIPSGWLYDRLGARRLTRVVLFWCFFIAATGWAWNLGSLPVIGLLFGAGESGCSPNSGQIIDGAPRDRG